MLKDELGMHDGNSAVAHPEDANHSPDDDDGYPKGMQMFVELQKHWLSELQCSREKILVEMTEKLHQEFLSDQQKIRTELLTEFKQELDEVRTNLEEQYRNLLNSEILQLENAHRRELTTVKKKQWCWHCENEAVYFCCWNTSYCSQQCQHDHWRTHRKYCRRRTNNRDGAAGPGRAGPSNEPMEQ
uniref:MYND-type domain-containing protein n=1 Tax=Panagrellus redivivus TaxID=6233 RepID=A0A7E4V0G7_PANRE